MKIKNLILSTAAIAMALGVHSVALAANTANGSYDAGTYTVSGTTDVANTPVKIEVLNNGSVIADLENAETDSEALAHYKYVVQINSGADGSFTYDIPVGTSPANHIVSVTYFGSETPTILSFATYTNDAMNVAIQNYIADEDKDWEGLNGLIESYYGGLEVDYSTYKSYTEAVKENICQNVVDAIDEDTTVDEFKTEVKKSIEAQKISDSTTANHVIDALETQSELFDLDGMLQFEDWKNCFLTEEEIEDGVEPEESKAAYKAEFASRFIGADMSAAEIKEYFRSQIVFDQLKDAKWSGQRAILDKYDEDTKVSESTINDVKSETKLKNVYVAFKNLVDQDKIDSVYDIKAKLDNLVRTTSGSTGSDIISPNSGLSSKDDDDKNTGSSFIPVLPATPEQPPQTVAFNDLGTATWAIPAITALNKAGIVNGKEGNSFCPSDMITREEIAVIIDRSINTNGVSAQYPFGDVAQDRWSANAIGKMYTMGIVGGMGNGVFAPAENVTREDIAVMLYRAASKIGKTLPAGNGIAFADATTISDYAVEAVDAMSGAGIINGTDTGFEPKRNATRAEATKMVYELLKYCNLID